LEKTLLCIGGKPFIEENKLQQMQAIKIMDVVKETVGEKSLPLSFTLLVEDENKRERNCCFSVPEYYLLFDESKNVIETYAYLLKKDEELKNVKNTRIVDIYYSLFEKEVVTFLVVDENNEELKIKISVPLFESIVKEIDIGENTPEEEPVEDISVAGMVKKAIEYEIDPWVVHKELNDFGYKKFKNIPKKKRAGFMDILKGKDNRKRKKKESKKDNYKKYGVDYIEAVLLNLQYDDDYIEALSKQFPHVPSRMLKGPDVTIGMLDVLERMYSSTRYYGVVKESDYHWPPRDDFGIYLP
jgi:hypothetical protein